MASSFMLKWMILLFTINFSLTPYFSYALNTNNSLHLTSLCQTTPYPNSCLNSLKLSITITINPNILTLILQTLQDAVSEAGKLSALFSTAGPSNLVEKQRGAIQDCKDLHQISLSALQKSMPRIQSSDARKIADARAFLSAALTNKNTCMEGLEYVSGPLKSTLVDSIVDTYKHVSNSLAMLAKKPAWPHAAQSGGSSSTNRHLLSKRHAQKGVSSTINRHLLSRRNVQRSGSTSTKRHAQKGGYYQNNRLSMPKWVARKHGRFLDDDDDDDEYDPSDIITVAKDGTGNFSTIVDAINFAPNNSDDRVLIYVREGVYKENVEIPMYKTNIVMLGDGTNVTLITGDRSVGDGWTTFRSATLAVSGEGFLARDITFENTAGPSKHQAVALRINADLTALYRCTISGYQDTLYVHTFRQFYRECDILGTVDFIFGNAAVVFQSCNIISKMPLPGQYTVITAQSRDTPDEATGISLQHCSILAEDELYSNSGAVKSFLGRPWKVYSTTVYLESFVDDFIDPRGWIQWSAANEGLDTLYYGEYNNNGPGSGTDNRVNWTGYHVMDHYDASRFAVSEFLASDEWLESTSFPYEDGI